MWNFFLSLLGGLACVIIFSVLRGIYFLKKGDHTQATSSSEGSLKATVTYGDKSKYIEKSKSYNEYAKNKTKNSEIVFLDTETTGLDPETDEVLEVSIVNSSGEVLLDSLIRPENRKRWPKAQQIHGITYQMVKDKPTLKELMPKIREATRGKHIVIYNKSFDTKFIPNLKNYATHISCCMLRYASFLSENNPYKTKYYKLTDAAKNVGYDWGDKPHRALSDSKATLAVWKWLDDNKAMY